MRLATLLFRKKMPKGNIWIGKDRMVPNVKERTVIGREKRLELEEQNMFYLRHPYLTLDQSWGHLAALGKGKALIQRKREEAEKWMTNVTMEERLETLRNTDKWD